MFNFCRTKIISKILYFARKKKARVNHTIKNLESYYSYLKQRIIDSFPRIVKDNIIILIPVLLSLRDERPLLNKL